MQSLKEKEEEIAKLKADLEITKLKAELERLKVSSGYPYSSSSSSDTLTQFRQQHPTKFDTKELSDEKLKILIKEETIARLALEKEENPARKIEEAKIKLEMRDLLKQNEEEEKAILKATEEQLQQAGKPLSQEEKDKLSAALFEMQNNRRKVMQNIVNNDSRFDTLLRMAENKSLDFGQKAVRMVRKVAGQDAADSGIVKMFSESLEKRRSELYPPGQLNDHTIQRNAAKTVILAAGAAALQALEVPAAVKSLLYFTTCESGWKYQTHGECIHHLNHISDDIILQRGMAAKAGLGLMGSLALGAGVKLAQKGIKSLISAYSKSPKHQSIKDSFEVDRDERAQVRIKVGYKVVSEKLKLS